MNKGSPAASIIRWYRPDRNCRLGYIARPLPNRKPNDWRHRCRGNAEAFLGLHHWYRRHWLGRSHLGPDQILSPIMLPLNSA